MIDLCNVGNIKININNLVVEEYSDESDYDIEDNEDRK